MRTVILNSVGSALNAHISCDRVAQSRVNGTWKLDVGASVEDIEAGTETRFTTKR